MEEDGSCFYGYLTTFSSIPFYFCSELFFWVSRALRTKVLEADGVSPAGALRFRRAFLKCDGKVPKSPLELTNNNRFLLLVNWNSSNC